MQGRWWVDKPCAQIPEGVTLASHYAAVLRLRGVWNAAAIALMQLSLHRWEEGAG